MKLGFKIKPFKLSLGAVGGGDDGNRWGKILELAGEACKYIVEDRIAEGVTIDGEPMLTGGGLPGTVARYTDAYEKWKSGGVRARIKKRSERKTRLPPKGGNKMRALYTPGDRFNVTGAMMRAWRVLETTATMVRVGFTSTREALKAWGNHIIRPTFALSREEAREMVSKVLGEVGLKVDE